MLEYTLGGTGEKKQRSLISGTSVVNTDSVS